MQLLHYCIPMPILKRFPSFKVEIRYRDHLPPHVPVLSRDRREVLVELETLAVAGNIPRHELAEVLAWIADNRGELLGIWSNCHP